MKEKLVQFGDEGRLSGIVSLPAKDSGEGKVLPVVIILSAGIVHRVGPNRLHVKLARAMAGAGFCVLRFDLSGLGESPSAPPGLGYEAQSIEDTKHAIAHMGAVFGERPVILAGLCSGADNAYRTALEAPLVTGLILLDPYAYQHQAAKMAYLAKRAQDPEKLGAFIGNLSARLTRMGQAASAESGEDLDPENDRIAPSLARFGADFQTLSERGVQTCIVYTHSVSPLINQSSQFFSTFADFDFKDCVSVEVMGDVDHTYTEMRAQDALMTHLINWMGKFKQT